jgi:chemotaxis protein methyltransferase CheR
MKQFSNVQDARALAVAIVDTLPEPFVVLDGELNVLAASRCFYEFFREDESQVRGQPFFQIGNGQWDIPALRLLIETIIPQQTSMEGFEVEHDFLDLGPRTMLLNARLVRYEDKSAPTILLAFQDITARRLVEREKQRLLERTERLLAEQQTLLREMEHRIANSLQIIASILLLKAKSVASEEASDELRDAHQRVMSVAAVQSHLHAVKGIERIDVAAYLTKLSGGLAASMVGPEQRIAIEVAADPGTLPTNQAVSLGLIVTELTINAIKYAFPQPRVGARIVVAYETTGSAWKLSVTDNGAGRSDTAVKPSGGLGTAIVAALAKGLEAEVREVPTARGVRIELIHSTTTCELPIAA